MGRRPYSDDIRELVAGEVLAGGSRRAAARRFKVSASSAVRWVDWHGRTGSVERRPGQGASRSPLEAHAAWLLDLVGKELDLTLAEIERRLLTDLGVRTMDSSIDRFFKPDLYQHSVSATRGRKLCEPNAVMAVPGSSTGTAMTPRKHFPTGHAHRASVLNTQFSEPIDIAVILAKFDAAWHHAPKNSIPAFYFGFLVPEAPHFDKWLVLAGPHQCENDRPPHEQHHRIRDCLRNQAEVS
jgi:transposase